MRATYNGGQAFPAGLQDFKGMTMLDWFAGQALQGLLAFDSNQREGPLAHASYKLARAMLAEKAVQDAKEFSNATD